MQLEKTRLHPGPLFYEREKPSSGSLSPNGANPATGFRRKQNLELSIEDPGNNKPAKEGLGAFHLGLHHFVPVQYMRIWSCFLARLPYFIAIVVFVFLALGTGCRQSAPALPTAKTATPVEVQTVRPKHGSITRNLTLPAEVRPYQEAILYAKVTGYLKTIAVDKGDRVKEGDLLADIEVPELLADRSRYKAELAVAEIDFKRLDESQKKAPDLVIPQAVDNARAKVDIAKANLEHTQALLNFAKLTAPFSGVVTRRMVDPGAFIAAATSGSTPSSSAILKLTDFAKVRVQIAIPEIDASQVKEGQPIILATEDLPRRSFDCKVTRFAYAIDDMSKTMLAEAELANPNLELRPGMYAIAKIGIQRKEDALLLPVDAVLVEKSGSYVLTVAGNKAKRVKVQTGFNDGSNVEILSGVNPQEQAILVGKKGISDGQQVVVTEAK